MPRFTHPAVECYRVRVTLASHNSGVERAGLGCPMTSAPRAREAGRRTPIDQRLPPWRQPPVGASVQWPCLHLSPGSWQRELSACGFGGGTAAEHSSIVLWIISLRRSSKTGRTFCILWCKSSTEQKGRTWRPIGLFLLEEKVNLCTCLMTERLCHMGTNNLPFACFRCCYEPKMKGREFLKIMRRR